MSTSTPELITEEAQAIRSDAFVEVSYDDAIPNNVDLSSDRQLLRALESWHPNYLEWWKDMGPEGFQNADVYLRTAVGVDPAGWAKFGYVKMPDYRWGILLAPKVEGRTIPCGRHKGQPAWQEVPGEYRSLLRRLIVVQGDTEPASVEQQRFLGKTAPFAVRHAQPLPGECGRRPPPLGHGLPAGQALRQGRARRSAGPAGAPQRAAGQPAHPRRLQRAHPGLAELLHVHLLHRPRRQDAARRAGRERV